MTYDRDAARLEHWKLFKAQYPHKVNTQVREEFDLWWKTRQTQKGGGLFLTLDEVEQMVYWMDKDGLKARDAEEES